MQKESDKKFELVMIGLAGLSIGVILSTIFYKKWFEFDCQNKTSLFNETLSLTKEELENLNKCENLLNFAIGFTAMAGVSLIPIIFVLINKMKEKKFTPKNKNINQELREINIINNEPMQDDLTISNSGSIPLSSIRIP